MIARVNLLPWRQRRRDRQRRAFLAQLGLVFAGSAILLLLTCVVLEGRIGNQDARNRFLLANIGELERRIDEIDAVRRRTDDTLARLRTISILRRDRAGTVDIFEELARTIAPGVHYISVVKRGLLMTARGIANSNNDISTLMRNLKNSGRFEAPRLKGIEEVADSQEAAQAVVFELTFATTVPNARKDGG